MNHIPESQDYGYFFYPPENPDEPGHPRLDVILRQKPTGTHFDPVEVRYPVVRRTGILEHVRISHPWEGTTRYRVFPGQISAVSNKGKELEAFTYGGELEITSTPEQTVCVLRSPAPILHVMQKDERDWMLATETEILLAERRAAHPTDPTVFDERLASVDPLMIYHAVLLALRERFQRLPQGMDETKRFIHFLQVENRQIHEQRGLPEGSARLEDLL